MIGFRFWLSIFALLWAGPILASQPKFRDDVPIKQREFASTIVKCALADAKDYWLDLFRLVPLKSNSGNNSVEKCVRQQGRNGFRMPALEMAGIFAEELYKMEHEGLSKIEGFPFEVVATNVRMRGKTYPMADCLVRKSPAQIDALLRSKPGSSEETEILQSLRGEASECGFGNVGRTTFRSSTAEMLFRRVTPSLLGMKVESR